MHFAVCHNEHTTREGQKTVLKYHRVSVRVTIVYTFITKGSTKSKYIVGISVVHLLYELYGMNVCVISAGTDRRPVQQQKGKTRRWQLSSSFMRLC